jgi:hypothetical protein
MKYFCSSPNCKNECGKQKEDNRIKMWRDPASVQGVIFCEKEFCDENGKLKSDY